MDTVPSTPLTPPLGGTVKPGGGCCPPPPPPPDYGCPVPGCPVPGNPGFHPPKPPCPPYPDPHEPGYWASDGDYPLPPAQNYKPPKPPPPPPQKPTVVPPPVPPVRYVPGMDVQEQLNHMANHVNQCVDRWNQIQHKCYEALDRVVGAAVSNDVYYEPDEVRFSSGYSSADGCEYHIVESRAVDKAGRPIKMRLMTAFNSDNPTVREAITSKSFVSSANAIITAVTPATHWKGLMMTNGNPQPTSPAVEGEWLCGWTKRGVLRLLPATETTVESACRNQIEDCIGPVIPIVMNGKPTQVAADFPAEPGAIQAIGWKQCNGNKVMFSCGFNDQPGCTVKNVADLLVSMGVTTAAVTCYMTGYGTPEIGGFVKAAETEPAALEEAASVRNVVGAAEKVDNNLGVVPEPWTAQTDSLSGQEILGLTGGMCYIASLAEQPLQFQIPQNAAYWVITKRPSKAGWPNRWTGEIADICQRLGINATELASIQGKLDLEQIQILDLQKRVGTLETNDKKQDDELADHEHRITELEGRMDTAEQDIDDLQTRLAQEVQDRIAGDDALREALQQETDNRIDGDNKLNDRVNQLRTALTEEITARNQADQDLSNSILNEVNARIAGDTQLSTKIDLTKITLEGEIQKEAIAREKKDDDLQEQIDVLEKDVSKINLKTGAGLHEVVTASGERIIEAYLDSGLRFNNLQQIAINTGAGIKLEDGRIVANLGDCLTFDEEGRITMACCDNSKLPLAGTGVDYGVDATTGDVILNVIPPQNGEIGGVKAGAGVTIAPDGTISANGGGGGEPYDLPPATKTTLGGVIVGDNITVDENGKISASSDYVLPIASPTVLGGVRVGKNLVIDQNGVLNAELPDLPAGEGDTVLAGDGIDVTKDAGERTATVSLNEATKGALNQVEDNKNAIDALGTRVTQVANSSVSNTLFQTTVQGINQNVTKAQGTADAAQVTANQANAAANDAADMAKEAKETAENAAAAFVNALPLSGGNMTGDIDFTQQVTARSEGGKPTVKGLPNPTEPDEAANKAYVDAAVSGADTSGLMPKTGGTFTGTVTMGAGAVINGVVNPTADSQAANKAYVDSLKPDIAAANTTAEAASSKADSAASTAATALQQSTDALTKAGQAQTAASGAAEMAEEAKTAAESASAAVEGGPFLPTSGGTMLGSIAVNGTTDSSNNFAINIYDNRAKNQVLQVNRQGMSLISRGDSTTKCSYGENGAYITREQNGIDTHVSLSKLNGMVGFSGTAGYNPSSGIAKIGGVETPTSDFEAANKKYVDEQVASVAATGVDTSGLVKKTGDTMTGALTLSGNPTAAKHAATKEYVDSKVAEAGDGDYLPLDGGGVVNGTIITANGSDSTSISGTGITVNDTQPLYIKSDGITFGRTSGIMQRLSLMDGGLYKGLFSKPDNAPAEEDGMRLGGVAVPFNEFDAANKKYVDDQIATVSGGTVDTSGLVKKTGDTMTGNLTTSGNLSGKLIYATGNTPTSGASGKTILAKGELNLGISAYPDQIVVGRRGTNAIMTACNSLTGSVQADAGVRISGVNAPSQDKDVANKAYVDGKFTYTIPGDLTSAAPTWQAMYKMLYTLYPVNYTFAVGDWQSSSSGDTVSQIYFYTRHSNDPYFMFQDVISLKPNKAIANGTTSYVGNCRISRNWLLNMSSPRFNLVFHAGTMCLKNTSYVAGEIYVTLSKWTENDDNISGQIDFLCTSDYLKTGGTLATDLTPVYGFGPVCLVK